MDPSLVMRAPAPELLAASLPTTCQEGPQRENKAPKEKMRAGVLLTWILFRSSQGPTTDLAPPLLPDSQSQV